MAIQIACTWNGDGHSTRCMNGDEKNLVNLSLTSKIANVIVAAKMLGEITHELLHAHTIVRLLTKFR